MTANLTGRAIALALIAATSFAQTPPVQPTSKAASTLDFQREIRPLLSDNCFQCHGPDSDTRMAGLRLDRKETALEPRRRSIVPGKSAESLLYQRITATTLPPHAARALAQEPHARADRQAQDLDRPGRAMAGALGLPRARRTRPPAVRNAAWSRNPIDRFILARLEARAWRPRPSRTIVHSSAASRST